MRRNALGLYDEPLWKDWLFYLTLFGVVAGLTIPESRATPIDLAIAVAFQIFLFGVLPGMVRAWLRRRHDEAH